MEFGGWGICTLFKAPPWIACIAGRISVGMLYCFGRRAEGRVGIQVEESTGKDTFLICKQNLKSRLPQFLGILNTVKPCVKEPGFTLKFSF